MPGSDAPDVGTLDHAEHPMSLERVQARMERNVALAEERLATAKAQLEAARAAESDAVLAEEEATLALQLAELRAKRTPDPTAVAEARVELDAATDRHARLSGDADALALEVADAERRLAHRRESRTGVEDAAVRVADAAAEQAIERKLAAIREQRAAGGVTPRPAADAQTRPAAQAPEVVEHGPDPAREKLRPLLEELLRGGQVAWALSEYARAGELPPPDVVHAGIDRAFSHRWHEDAVAGYRALGEEPPRERFQARVDELLTQARQQLASRRANDAADSVEGALYAALGVGEAPQLTPEMVTTLAARVNSGLSHSRLLEALTALRATGLLRALAAATLRASAQGANRESYLHQTRDFLEAAGDRAGLLSLGRTAIDPTQHPSIWMLRNGLQALAAARPDSDADLRALAGRAAEEHWDISLVGEVYQALGEELPLDVARAAAAHLEERGLALRALPAHVLTRDSTALRSALERFLARPVVINPHRQTWEENTLSEVASGVGTCLDALRQTLPAAELTAVETTTRATVTAQVRELLRRLVADEYPDDAVRFLPVLEQLATAGVLDAPHGELAVLGDRLASAARATEIPRPSQATANSFIQARTRVNQLLVAAARAYALAGAYDRALEVSRSQLDRVAPAALEQQEHWHHDAIMRYTDALDDLRAAKEAFTAARSPEGLAAVADRAAELKRARIDAVARAGGKDPGYVVGSIDDFIIETLVASGDRARMTAAGDTIMRDVAEQRGSPYYGNLDRFAREKARKLYEAAGNRDALVALGTVESCLAALPLPRVPSPAGAAPGAAGSEVAEQGA